jgi:vitamin B12 transporter
MRYCFLFLLIVLAASVHGQQLDTLKRTYLDEVSVYGLPVSRYASGTKVERISSASSASLLTSALSGESSIYFKNYGNEQLSTIALRGTSASHTAVLWNGINVSSPTLGQTDFSLFPAYLLEDITLQYGTSSSQYGSDALGGTVLLGQSKPQFTPGLNVQFLQQAGSFGRYFTGLKLQLANSRWEFRTKIMYRTLENNFKFNSPAVGYEKTQDHASVNTSGFNQQIHYNFSKNRWASFEVFHVYNFREIQSTVTYSGDAVETLRDVNTRFNLSYQGLHRAGNIYASVAYLINDQVFNKTSRTRIDQVTSIVNFDRAIGQRSSFRCGANASAYFADVANYKDGSLQENRYDLFASLNHSLLPFWNFSLNLRQSFYAGHHAPFSPSLGTELKLLNMSKHKLMYRVQISRGYRVPTLNDRYWQPTGNPKLKPEDAFHIENGLNFSKTTNRHHIIADVSGYITKVNQWILWQPDTSGQWAPSNLQRVNASGVEASIKHKYTREKFSVNSGIKYSYTSSKNLKGLTPSDNASIGKQLPYVPYHLSNAFIMISSRSWASEVSANYISLRFATLDNNKTPTESLEAYTQLNISVSRKIEWQMLAITTKLNVNNVLNTYYETLKSHAMPGRNLNFSLVINYKNK